MGGFFRLSVLPKLVLTRCFSAWLANSNALRTSLRDCIIGGAQASWERRKKKRESKFSRTVLMRGEPASFLVNNTRPTLCLPQDSKLPRALILLRAR